MYVNRRGDSKRVLEILRRRNLPEMSESIFPKRIIKIRVRFYWQNIAVSCVITIVRIEKGFDVSRSIYSLQNE